MNERSTESGNIPELVLTNWFFPAVMLIWGLISIFFGEKLPAQDGLGIDGARYADIARNLFHSKVIDNYYVLRFYPSILVHVLLSVFALEFSNANIIRGFEFLNLISLVAATYFVKLSMNELRIIPKIQVIAFSLFLFTHPMCKILFYAPVMTDAPGVCLGAMMFYFYIKGQNLNLVLSTVIGTFTLPLLLYLGVILILFPRQYGNPEPIRKSLQLLLSALSVGFISFVVYYWVYKLKAEVDSPYALQIDPDLMYISLIILIFTYAALTLLLSDGRYFRLGYWLGVIRPYQIALALVVFSVTKALAAYLNYEGKVSGYLSIDHTFSGIAVIGLVRPGIFITSYTFYFGLLPLLLCFFWNKFCRQTLNFGPGLPFALLFVLLLFVSNSQSRVLNCVFPWFVVLFANTINDYQFGRSFVFSIPVINLLISRVWWPIGFGNSPINSDGTVGFPNQKYMMSFGLWVSEAVWFVQLVILLLLIGYFFLLLFKFRCQGRYLLLTKRYLPDS